MDETTEQIIDHITTVLPTVSGPVLADRVLHDDRFWFAMASRVTRQVPGRLGRATTAAVLAQHPTVTS